VKGKWGVDGYNVEDNFFSRLRMNIISEARALIVARKWDKIFRELVSDKEGEISRRVYIVRPDGTRYRFVSDN
jgi:hypothetical protein